MATINNGESGLSVRNKINEAINKVDGATPFSSISIESGTADLSSLDLTAIAETKAVTAVDVFVYDTSKDSDGGAWRKRTQHTSWYNETLNTATRGSRREFPAVAVVVAEADKVTIYDGDDPTLPMWMVFNGDNSYGSTKLLRVTNGAAGNSISALNGSICVTSARNDGGFVQFNMISEFGRYHTAAPVAGNNAAWRSPISARNGGGQWANDGLQGIVNYYTNDVAMTVLPDAPIDPATGLPVPTIAVATDGGVSVIKDDGTVVDITPSQGAGFGAIRQIDLDENNVYFVGANANRSHIVKAIPSSDTTFNSQPELATDKLAFTEEQAGNLSGAFLNGYRNVTKIKQTGSDRFAFNGDCLNLLKGTSPSTSMVAYTTSTYNTGWMNGDIKGAFLADTDDTDLVGSGELVTNGTFDTDVSGWTASTGATVTHDTNRMKVFQGTSNDYVVAYQAIATVIGKTYTASFDLIDDGSSTSSGVLYIRTQPTGSNIVISESGFGAKSVTFTATSTTTYISAGLGTATDNVYALFDNISVKLADADRSVNNNGLIVNGTVTRSAVATGAELVAYSGFSASNYLEQPYNSDLDFGTGDFCVMGWVKHDGTNSFRTIASNVNDDLSAPSYQFVLSGDDTPYAFFFPSTTSTTTGKPIPTGVWSFVSFVRSNGIVEVKANGELVSSVAYSGSIGGITNGVSCYGARKRPNGTVDNAANNVDLALWRISATAPTADQIRKIYEDEKVLFQENAACTLYGASDAVTALAHDPVTDLLHVGTSAGRSVFQGLRRVSNTTTAVGTAISASNDLVVEE